MILKNRLVCVVAIVTILSLFVASGSKKASSYKRDAENFCDEVLSAAANLEDVGNEVKSEWHDYIYDTWSSYDSVDEAVDGAHENMSSEVDAAISSKDEIDKMYNKLKKPANKNEELVEICEAVKNLYEEYENLYEIVINPWGNYNDFSDDFRNYDGSTVDAYEELKDLFE